MLLSSKKLFLLCVCALGVSLFSTTASFAQLNSNTATVTLNATLGESLTVAATPGNVNFALVPGGVAAGSAPVAVTTTWVLNGTRSSVVLDAYFSSTNALSSGANNIPTSAVLGQVTTGTPTVFTAFTQTTAFGAAGAGLTLFTQAVTNANRSSSRNDNLNLEINLASVSIPSATYTGTLTLQAQAL